MTRSEKANLDDFDWHLLAVALVLSLIGLTFVWSTTSDASGDGGLLSRQLLYIGAVLPLVAVVVRVPYSSLARVVVPTAYFGSLMVLVVLLLRSGDEVRNTQAFIRLPFGFMLQPSEFVKVLSILMLAVYLRYKSAPRTLKDLVAPFALAGVPMLLIAKQPDLGSAVILGPTVFAMLIAAGMRLRLVFGLGAVVAALGVALYFSPLMHDYQRARINNFFESIPAKTELARQHRAQGEHKEAERLERELRDLKLGRNFQVYHAMISIGSGGLTGQGIGGGLHNRLDYLPERHNDFIFAVVGEEWGFLGGSIILGLYFLLVALIFGVARRTRDGFGRLICVGIGTMFGFQAFLNTGVATGLLPVTGVTLPFLSFGGSSMLSSFLALALVLNVGLHRVTVLDGETFGEKVFGEMHRA